MKTVIINADDVGLCEAVNKAVKNCLIAGAITDVSLMPCGRSFKEACVMLRDLKKIQVGVHLTLTGKFAPCAENKSKIKTLIRENGLFSDNYNSFIFRYLSGKVSLFETYFEFRNQIQKVIEEGFKITHLDSHEHIHIFSKVLDIIVRLAKEFDIPYIRIPDESFIVMQKEFKIKDLLRQMVLKIFILRAKRIVKSKHIKTSDTFWGHFHSGRINDDILLFIVKNLLNGVNELAVHLATASPDLIETSPWHKNAPLELDALLNGKWHTLLASEGIRLISHKEVF